MTFLIGADENGLGSRLGPMVVTGVLAEADERGKRALSRKLPKRIREDLDDSKRLLSHTDFALGEAWARALTGDTAATPADLFQRLSLEGETTLRKPCPSAGVPQCWSQHGEEFSSTREQVERVTEHIAALAERGVRLLEVRSSVVCTGRLNALRARGINRFVSDLHAMENLILHLQARAGAPIEATCGKVGGIGEYGKFFGPLSGWLHAIIQEGQAESAYHFPRLGRLRFVRDADARAPLVMLASLVGKYLRELFMSRIARHYPASEAPRPSGYHDPVTAAFVKRIDLVRRERGIPDRCFERDRDPVGAQLSGTP
jgi:ribonuclease HII